VPGVRARAPHPPIALVARAPTQAAPGEPPPQPAAAGRFVRGGKAAEVVYTLRGMGGGVDGTVAVVPAGPLLGGATAVDADIRQLRHNEPLGVLGVAGSGAALRYHTASPRAAAAAAAASGGGSPLAASVELIERVWLEDGISRMPTAAHAGAEPRANVYFSGDAGVAARAGGPDSGQTGGGGVPPHGHGAQGAAAQPGGRGRGSAAAEALRGARPVQLCVVNAPLGSRSLVVQHRGPGGAVVAAAITQLPPGMSLHVMGRVGSAEERVPAASGGGSTRHGTYADGFVHPGKVPENTTSILAKARAPGGEGGRGRSRGKGWARAGACEGATACARSAICSLLLARGGGRPAAGGRGGSGGGGGPYPPDPPNPPALALAPQAMVKADSEAEAVACAAAAVARVAAAMRREGGGALGRELPELGGELPAVRELSAQEKREVAGWQVAHRPRDPHPHERAHLSFARWRAGDPGRRAEAEGGRSRGFSTLAPPVVEAEFLSWVCAAVRGRGRGHFSSGGGVGIELTTTLREGAARADVGRHGPHARVPRSASAPRANAHSRPRPCRAARPRPAARAGRRGRRRRPGRRPRGRGRGRVPGRPLAGAQAARELAGGRAGGGAVGRGRRAAGLRPHQPPPAPGRARRSGRG
jgi:hypothetical protein